MSSSNQHRKEPIAVVGFACRLPGRIHSPQNLWDFLERGGIADNSVPTTRFNVEGHFDGSRKPRTMRQGGGMFLDDIDLADFDAGFFGLGHAEATAMDPAQRQMLEVVYEALENSGIPLERIDGQRVGCYVGSYASDYGDMASRDPEDRPAGSPLGIARSMLSNRLSHFLNVKGPSMTLDTACSSSMVSFDLACQSLWSDTSDVGIVAAANVYMSPEHMIDAGVIADAQSPSALCHTFDAAADGYVKAEAVSAVIVKRLADAVRDRDPIRAVILGTASNHNGWTAGIASPSGAAQALCIRAAYANAGITDFNQTTFLECHGTATQAGDANEVSGAASVFSPTRSVKTPLIIGSIKSNIGHSEPASGLSGMMKAVLSIENGVIPGNPTFITPSSKIDWIGSRVRASRTRIPWPLNARRRASVNSFGIGGSNAHAVIEAASSEDRIHHVSSYINSPTKDIPKEAAVERPYSLVLSANTAASLEANITKLCAHLKDPRVKINITDLAHTLSERRTHLFHRAFASASATNLNETDFVLTKKTSHIPKIGYIFTGQGAQWPQMGKQLLESFPWTRSILEDLDQVLQGLPKPPKWSLVSELIEPRRAEYMRQPEIAQPLVTALQICIHAVLDSWNIKPSSVVGHSSGEVMAAYAAGWLDRPGALKAAFYRGQAAKEYRMHLDVDVGMLAVGLSAEQVAPYLEKHTGNAVIGCFNGPTSLTLSGLWSALDVMAAEIKADGHFARALQVDLAYHSPFTAGFGEGYRKSLDGDHGVKPVDGSSSGISWFSSVIGCKKETPGDPSYWIDNMVSPVHFDQALAEMVKQEAPNILIEIGPAAALAGPVSQVLKDLPSRANVSYCSAWSRNDTPSKTLLNLAGYLFATGASVDMTAVNRYSLGVRTIIDLPNYSWNHSVKYWHESAASKDWRFRKFPVHDLLGSKVLGTPWSAPVWRNRLNADNIPWILEHSMGGDAIMPGAGFLTLGLEALYQKHCALNYVSAAAASPNDFCYCFRNVRFQRALVVEAGKDVRLMLTLNKVTGSDEWHEFRISSSEGDTTAEHCFGSIRIQDPVDDIIENPEPLKASVSGKLWYKAFREIGMGFGPKFQSLLRIESTSGSRTCRSLISLVPPQSALPQSYYPLHPAALDGLLQSPIPANVAGERINVHDAMLPKLLDECIINKLPKVLSEGLSCATSVYSGRGRPDQEQSWIANASLYNVKNGALLGRITGLRYVKLDIPIDPDIHSFNRVSWEPDVSFLTQGQIMRLNPGISGPVHKIIDLIANKKPALEVLEINLHHAANSCTWFGGDNLALRSAYVRYDFATTSSEELAAMQTSYGDRKNASFQLVDQDVKKLMTEYTLGYDLVIVKAYETGNTILNMARQLLSPEGKTIVMMPPTHDSGLPMNEESWSLLSLSPGFDKPLFIERESRDGGENSTLLLKVHNKNIKPVIRRNLIITSFNEFNASTITSSLRATLEASEWGIFHGLPKPGTLVEGDVVLFFDEPYSSILRHVDEKQWASIKSIATSGQPLLWVTHGAQSSVTNPDGALVYGMLRAAGREDTNINFTILDVQSNTGSAATEWAIEQVLALLAKGVPKETHYMERNGILHIQRIVPDIAINNFKRAEIEGHLPVVQPFYQSKSQVHLRAERLGTLESLTWCETDMCDYALEPNFVEVKVMAAGVNFKDVAITMGILPDNEYSLGFECAGFVTGVGSHMSKLKVGDRVCILQQGMYANRVRVPVERCHKILESMSFETAATIPCVFITSLYALYHLANLREGQSVLIHSAAGGVGIACIELARHKKAEIYVTVGTEEKRRFLESKYGIPGNRMFSSRNIKFAAEIMRETAGRGVDVVINSLVGELLDASWRIVADGGTMVEIGKKDIVDRNTLAMEPFDRNCSFRAIDFSYTKHINGPMVAKLFSELFDLFHGGFIKPITPVTTFSFDSIQTALATIRAGRHIGKIVVSNGDESDLILPIRPAIRKLKLRQDVSYLIVGGLKGVCGTLAIHMAQHGARNIVVCSRSGLRDEASARVVQSCLSYGCKIVGAQGDISGLAWVKKLIKNTSPRIAGVIQGAMVLQDMAYERMGAKNFHVPLNAKVQGTWNLHNATAKLLEQPLDFFTMLSSTSGVVGKRGQSNYAAANSFLDAFASYRQQQGLCANTVDLGLIEDVGYVADDSSGLEARINKHHWIPINERMLRKILTLSILQQDSHAPLDKESSAQLVTGIAYPYPQDGSDISREPRFSHLCAVRGQGQNATRDTGDSGDKIEQAVRALQLLREKASDKQLLSKACLDVVATQFAKTLRLGDEEIEMGKSPMAYGLDSLSAVEFRNWFRQKLDVALTTLDITNANSLVAISEKVVSKMLQSGNET